LRSALNVPVACLVLAVIVIFSPSSIQVRPFARQQSERCSLASIDTKNNFDHWIRSPS
jgi:hypothetical protein